MHEASVIDADDDFVAINVLTSRAMMRVRVDGELPGHAPLRLRALATSREIVAVPVMSGADCVAIIELVDTNERCKSILPLICGLLGEQLVRVLARARDRGPLP